MTGKLSKADLKQVDLNIEDNRSIYLYKIILIVRERMRRLEGYIIGIGEELLRENDHKNIPYEDAMLYFDATDHLHCYLLNVLGDSQNTSISYFKYRNFCKKKKYRCVELDDETEAFLIELNKERNFCNHIPESILIEDIQKIMNDSDIQKDKISFFKNNNQIIHDSVEYDYFNLKHEGIKRFYFGVKHVLEYIIKDNELILGSQIKCNTRIKGPLKKVEVDYVLRAAKNVQKIDGTIPDKWIDF